MSPEEEILLELLVKKKLEEKQVIPVKTSKKEAEQYYSDHIDQRLNKRLLKVK